MGLCGSKEVNNGLSYHMQTVDEHEGGINCMTLSEDSSVLATAGEDRTVRLWSTATDYVECLGVLKGHEDYINNVLVEPSFVLTASADRTVRKWDLATCECLLVMSGHTSLVNRLLCSGDFVFSSSYDRTARCWDVDTGETIRVFTGHTRGVYPMIFLPSADYKITPEDFDWDYNKDILVTGSADFTIKAWSFETGKVLLTYKGHTGAVTSLAYDPTIRQLYSSSTDHSIRSWDLLKAEVIKVFEGHQASVISITLVGRFLYSVSSDHTARSWVAEFGALNRTYKGHRHTVSCMEAKKGLVFTGCGDGEGRCFDEKTGILRRTFLGHNYAINCLQIVGDRLFTGSHDGSIRIWSLDGLWGPPAKAKQNQDDYGAVKYEEFDNNENELNAYDDTQYADYNGHPPQQVAEYAY